MAVRLKVQERYTDSSQDREKVKTVALGIQLPRDKSEVKDPSLGSGSDCPPGDTRRRDAR